MRKAGAVLETLIMSNSPTGVVVPIPTSPPIKYDAPFESITTFLVVFPWYISSLGDPEAL